MEENAGRQTIPASQATQPRAPSYTNNLGRPPPTPTSGAAATSVSPATIPLPGARPGRLKGKGHGKELVRLAGGRTCGLPRSGRYSTKATSAVLIFLRDSQASQFVSLSALGGAFVCIKVFVSRYMWPEGPSQRAEAATAGFLHDFSISHPRPASLRQPASYHAVVMGLPNLLHPNCPPNSGASYDSNPQHRA